MRISPMPKNGGARVHHRGGKGGKGPWGGVGYMEEEMHNIYAQPPRGPPPRSAIAGKRGGKGFGPPPMEQYVGMPMQPMGPPPPHVLEQCYNRAHDAITSSVWEAVQEIAHLETTKTDSEIAKRVTRYMYKAVSNPELVTLQWEELCRDLVKGMFHGYSAACGEAEWFFQIELAPALSAAAMVLLPVLGWRVPPNQVFESISNQYNLSLDRITLDRAMWEMVESLFADDEKARTKLFHAIGRTYDPALQTALSDPTPMDEISRVEIFTKAWIDDSISRAWGGLGDKAETTLSEETVVDIFDHLLQPFGEDHPFSAIPRQLTEENGPPPPGWDFLPQVVQGLFASWNQEAERPAKKRKKNASFEEADPDADEAEQQPSPVRKPVPKRASRVKKEIGCGHPSCTSGPDCAGAPEDGLVQHILEEGPGDVYCDVCWNSFKQRSPELEGVPFDE